MLYLVYLTESDGEPVIKPFLDIMDIVNFVKEEDIFSGDYAVINGELIKDFDEVHIKGRKT